MQKQDKFANLDDFLDWFKSMRPETIYLVKDKRRYAEVMDAIRTIYDFAHASNPDGTVLTTPAPDQLIGDKICIEIISNLVVFEDMKKLCAALSKASNFEIVARTDGKASIGIVFEDVYDFAPPRR
jgi:hypothetical protein